jgi:uncharacterized protein (TIGR03435 family)
MIHDENFQGTFLGNRSGVLLLHTMKQFLTPAAQASMLLPLALGAVAAQSEQSVTFEVASIKPCQIGDAAAGRKGGREGGGTVSSGRLTVNCQTLANLIRIAYLQYASGAPSPVDPVSKMEFSPISGRFMQQALQHAPAWIESDRYTIEAKAGGAAAPEMMRGPMMQALLADRFKLKFHRETREVPVYALTVAKGGHRLQAAKDGMCIPFDSAHPSTPSQPFVQTCGPFFYRIEGSADAYHMSMSSLCRELSRLLDRDVVDKTGVTGLFDIHMDLSPADLSPGPRDAPPNPNSPVAASDPPGSLVFAAVQKLGLKLEPAKNPSEFFVIDHVERPSGN